jgi:two-component system CheB/CheR fusion protein
MASHRKKSGRSKTTNKGDGKSRASAKAPAAPDESAVSVPPPGFSVVAVGASAGGLEALEALFKSMPPDLGVGFVLVVHLDPTHVSLLPELLQKHTKMPVCHAVDGTLIERNHVYVIPPNRELTILRGHLKLLGLPHRRGLNMPIDAFFQSLSQDQAANAIGIILSGTGTDGTLGIKAIKSALGMVMVQDEESAKYDGMPRCAIATGLADYVLPPDRMPDRLVRYLRHATKRAGFPNAEIAKAPTEALQKIFVILRTRTDHDFSLYKKNTICRRIERRMNVHQIDSLDDYARYLQESDREADILFKELLIGVTNFFRDPAAFQILQEEILPQLLAAKPEDSVVRVWVPGCATGEEAYSVAIALLECMERIGRHFHIQIFGTDIDEDAIAVARAGRYPKSILADVDPGRIKRYFNKEENGHYRINKLVREMLVFATQNLIKDPPFTKLDLLCCRNLLIYLGPELQRNLFPLFHYSLLANGILFLGSSETIGTATDRFASVNKNWKIFRRQPLPSSARAMLEFPVRPAATMTLDLNSRPPAHRTDVLDVVQLVEAVLQLSGTPPCAIVNDAGNTVYIHGRTGRFLELAEGRTTVNIVEMSRPGLKKSLAAALRQVASNQQEVICRGLKIDHDGSRLYLNLTVRPILNQTAMRGLLMVIFEETAQPSKPAKASGKTQTPPKEKGHARTAENLEEELRFTRENLQTTIEELETTNEELKSTNEELQSTNEELQSTNEELETSKEELQSLNEESATVNAELRSRYEELSKANDDMKNLLDSTDIATVFLDPELRIRRFTPKATTILPLTSTDAGRPIRHLASRLIDIDLAEFGRQVMEDLIVRAVEVTDDADHHYFMRVRPYRTVNNVIDGVVITFEDTTDRKIAERGMRESEQRFRLLFDLASDSIVLINPADDAFIEYNHNAHSHLGYSSDEFAKMTINDIDGSKSGVEMGRKLKQIPDTGGTQFQTRHRTKSGALLDVELKAKIISIEKMDFILCSWHDVTPA